MALSNKDIEKISKAYSSQLEAIAGSMEKVLKLVEDHEYSLYGVDRKNGISSEVKTHGEQLKELQTFKARVVGYASGAGAIAGIAITQISKLFK